MPRRFDGVNDELSLGLALATTTPFTFACWFKRSLDTGADNVLMSAYTHSSNDNQFRIGH